MPPLNCMQSKSLQLAGLRTVRLAAVTSFRQLEEEEKRICRLFLQMAQSRQQRSSLHITGDFHQDTSDLHHDNEEHTGSLYYNNQSQAEATLYK